MSIPVFAIQISENQSKTQHTRSNRAFSFYRCQTQESALPPHVIAGIEKAIAEDDAGQTISFDEFRQRHFLSKK
jgi:hypothetical protein